MDRGEETTNRCADNENKDWDYKSFGIMTFCAFHCSSVYSVCELLLHDLPLMCLIKFGFLNTLRDPLAKPFNFSIGLANGLLNPLARQCKVFHQVIHSGLLCFESYAQRRP